ncbi:autotransporter outer membrane beta-barrel domain-containing protein [Escherichia coli]
MAIIQLIEVGGNSAGSFCADHRNCRSWADVYTLAKGRQLNGKKNWHPDQKWDGVTPPDTPAPIKNPPVVDPEGPSVYRPEAGSYISNIAAATRRLAIAYTTVWVSRNIQIHCILRVQQAVCGCVMSGGTNVPVPETAS